MPETKFRIVFRMLTRIPEGPKLDSHRLPIKKRCF